MSNKFSYKKAAAEKEHEPIRSGDTVVVSSAEAKAPAARAASDKPKPPVENQDAKILRVLKASLERLKGRGMPELDVEITELVSELEGAGK